MTELAASGIRLSFRPDTGLLESFAVTDGGQVCAPLHRAPWVGTGAAMPADAAPHLAHLGGDFFCAPFAGREDGSGLHGWPANAPWRVEQAEAGRLHATLDRRVSGAVLTKTLRLRDGHPFVYQTHVFHGGSGRVPVANHANVSLLSGGLIRTSAKHHWETPGTVMEGDPARGRSCLRYPARAEDPAQFPGAEGPVDLSRYPWGPRHEDFAIGVEARGHALGWTAVTRPAQGDLFLSLRNARALPMTMLWHSNGGRDYAPWSGRHFGCLGVEEGAAAQMLGLSGETDLCGLGAVTLSPDTAVPVRHVIGAISWPSGQGVAALRVDADSLTVSGEAGAQRRVPFDATFLALEDIAP
jgi:hypothetical protein